MRVAIIDNIAHKKTKSFDFIIDLITNHFGEKDVAIFYHHGGDTIFSHRKYIDKIDDFDVFIFLEISPSPHILYALKDKKTIIVPMYDGITQYKHIRYYFSYFGVSVVSFSQRVHGFFRDDIGIDTMYIQYYLKPLNYTIHYDKRNIYWRYRGNVSRSKIKKIIGSQYVDRLTIKNIPDPGHKPLQITPIDIKRYNIRVIDTFFSTHEEHYKNLAEHNIFIAPRLKEGIGMSFLDALSLGMCVIGHDEATMDEYINHEKDGILTKFIDQVDIENYQQIGQAAFKRYEVGYANWEAQKKSIIQYILKKKIKYNYNIMRVLIAVILYYMGMLINPIIFKIYYLRNNMFRN